MKRLLRILPALLGLAAVTFSAPTQADPSGHKWFALPVNYRLAATVDNNGTTQINGNIAYASVIAATQSSFATWTQAQVSGTNWNSNFTGTYTSPAGKAALNDTDNQNSLIWLSGSDWTESSSTLGLTFTSWVVSTGEILDADTEMNNNQITWDDTGTNPLGYDYPSVILHEAGHFLGLNHSASAIAVMYAFVNEATIKRVLASPDISDVTSVYPIGGGGQGTTCVSTNPQCQNGLTCRADAAATAYICTVDCTVGGAACPTGYTCQASTGGNSCLPQTSIPDLCAYCTDGSQCSSGICVTDGLGHNWCTTTCTSAASCGPNYNCMATANNGSLCVPSVQCTNQCTGTGQSLCPIGEACTGGWCSPTGNPGDRCELTGVCKVCNVCVGTQAEAFCRACCAGAQNCASCNPTACGTDAVCTLLASTDSVCIPNNTTTLCGACSNGTCPNGEECVAGTCHTTCNPDNPGACGACYDMGGGNGVCACANETAIKGQQCGPVGNGFFACQQGLVCTGTPPTCAAPCDISDPNSCASGEKCQQMGSVAICVAGTIGSQCAACGTNNACDSALTCVSNRCYPTCNVNTAGTCSTCVQTDADGTGICACSDQIVGVGGKCQADPLAVCSSGLVCVDALCRAQCDQTKPSQCGVLEECLPYPDDTHPVGYFCLPVSPGVGGGGGGTSSTGGGTATGGGKHGTGGGGGNAKDNTGCGCQATELGALWPLLSIAGLALRRRTRTRR